MEKLNQSVNTIFLFVLVFAGIYFASPFLIPVALAAVLSMVFIRLCNFIERKGVGRAYASLMCILLFVLSVGLIIGLLSIQLGSLAENLGGMEKRLTNMFESLKQWVNEAVGIKKDAQQKVIDQSTKGKSSGMILSFAAGFMGIMINTILVLVYMFLFLSMRGHIKKFILKLVPKKENADTTDVIQQTGQVAQKYLSGLAAMIVMLWIMYGIGFSIVGVKSALFFAVLCGLLEIVPFVGNLTGTSLTVLAVVAQGGDSKMIIGVLITYFLVQFIQTYILEPIVVGEQVNINPLFTIMAIILGELIWGVAGMVLAVPLIGMLKIICDSYPHLQPYGYLLGPENPRKPKTSVVDYLKKLFSKN
ncbi:AI-2E family transporter [Pedobacter frigidisoli]|uniref:AI-2E family transporter n=1 Tax=Pedobacter frigidisoli TaxID=2530455 RepID=A0A4R0P4U4_9SPHI|nr:AI-2E family transporter [Pedobacter frigidisoli]TCD10819.1 AI-2E family transporter [Pedobacter frigidisoli]